MRTYENEFWSLVGRYYDPATDQFISVDPDVAETGQPYAFTGDDPLDATDPLGDKGNKVRCTVFAVLLGLIVAKK